MSSHGKIITYNELAQVLPSRNDFLSPQESKQVDEIINNKQPLLFLPTYLIERHLQPQKYQKGEYKIILMGILKDGRRVNILIDGIEPYFEVIIPDTLSEEEKLDFIEELRVKMDSNDLTKPTRAAIVKGKPFKYYQSHISKFVRFYYKRTTHKTQSNRKSAISFAKSNGYTTYTDDLTNYYRVVCRDFQTTFSSWAELSDYEQCDLSDQVKGISYRVSIKKYKTYTGELTNDLLKDKTLSCCWDIETYSSRGLDLPKPGFEEDNIFCLSMTFQWVNQNEPFFKVCFCDLPSEPHEDYLTVVCGNENNIIKAFGDTFAKMRPEFIFGFNDSDYDWDWVIKRASEKQGLLSYLAKRFDSTVPFYPYTDDAVLNWNFRREHVKVEADNYVDGFSLMMPGYIPVDVRTTFRRLYPTSENTSLKWYLADNKLSGKDDMPHTEIHRIYGEYKELLNSEYLIPDRKTTLNLKFNSKAPVEILEKYEKVKRELTLINKYCVIDSQRCHDLIKIRNIIMDHREVSNLAYMNLYDAFYRANGVKVRNLTICEGQAAPFNLRFSNNGEDDVEEGKYPGAFVFPPKKGLKISKLSITERIEKAKRTENEAKPALQEWLNTDEKEVIEYQDLVANYGVRHTKESIEKIEVEIKKKIPKKVRDFLMEPSGLPIAGLDFSSLYPSLIRTYNFSPEYCVLDTKKAKELADAGHTLTKVDFEFNGKRRVGYFVWHNNELEPMKEVIENGETKRVPNPDFKFGICPYILNKLFDKRAALKKQMKKYKSIKEVMEKKINAEAEEIFKTRYGLDVKIPDIKKGTPEEALSITIIKELEAKYHTQEYEDDIFNLNYLNSKQNALKVFMNTFYGEMGNKKSPFFVIEVAGGITSYGQKNIKKAYKFCTENECAVYYGDTDSLYISMPERIFDEVDRAYYSGKITKLEYWTKLVELSFVEIERIKTGVNTMFFEDNKTKFLSMAYEEFLYPVVFTAKKKYYGIAHEEIVNFKPKELFLKGLDVKKRGVSSLLKKIFYEIMWTTMDPNNLYDILELVHKKIDDIYDRKWDVSDFIETAVYKPHKKNVKVNTFVRRMKEEGIEVKPYERFSYIITQKYPYNYDIRGRKQELSVGDKIEFVDRAEQQGMKVDLDHYMESSINGQLGRLITYHPMFHVDPLEDTPDELHVAETKIYKNACKYIKEIASKYYAKYNTFGKTHQKIFRTVNKHMGTAIQKSDSVVSKLLGANVDVDDFENWLIEMAEKDADKQCKDYGYVYVTNDLDTLKAYHVKNMMSAKEKNLSVDKILEQNAQINKAVKKAIDEQIALMQKIYYGRGAQPSISDTREDAFKQTMSILRRRIRDNLKEFRLLFSTYYGCITTLTNILKEHVKLSADMYEPNIEEGAEYKLEDFGIDMKNVEKQVKEEAEQKAADLMNDTNIKPIIESFRELYYDILSAFLIIKRTRSIVGYLKILRDKKNKVVARPDEEIIKANMQKDIEELMNSDVVF
jgi:DNA polymerase elongation subunit (family B)